MFRKLFGKSTVRESSVVLLDQGALSLAAFFTGVLVARAVPKEDYGLYVLDWSAFMIVQGLHRGITSLPFTRNCSIKV